ncbi:NAD(P)/FAD-dependent oxidoreductase [Roseimaritima ulvae]|uniref:NADH:ubiquinone reductase (non-electrogenic) n=1 Tax=Roseimaritima ulvae TaxID=980254 RepID=A0A5B9QWE2_9BACT|nr:NAD(P)/FAD-dependent oxidoreductase [Roseimaritima ulvae]QEG42100.1 NADH dehydrogenase-like protein [Roseimaritima ulvae]
MAHAVIIGGGFAGINAAKRLGRSGKVSVTILDQRNHHLFQPLLYQVAMAGLDPSDIAVPIRALMRPYRRVRTLLGRAETLDLENREVRFDGGVVPYDYLIVACGASHSYFGNDQWESHAPGLKSVGQATEIRRRVLVAFEQAERASDPEEQARWMTFVIVGGGPTGVELAGAIAEMARYALSKDFRTINSADARVLLVQSGERILKQFDADQAEYATKSLRSLGVEVVLESRVTNIGAAGIEIGETRVPAGTVLWAAGVQANRIGLQLKSPLDRAGRVIVRPDLTIPDHDNVFVVGDLAHTPGPNGNPLPGLAPVAIQAGRYVADLIVDEVRAENPPDPAHRKPFEYNDKGQMATIGRKRAIMQYHKHKKNGFLAWVAWLLVHIYFLSGFRNRFFVFLKWCWAYLTFSKGARLIIQKEWRQHESELLSPVVGSLDETYRHDGDTPSPRFESLTRADHINKPQ